MKLHASGEDYMETMLLKADVQAWVEEPEL